MECSVKYTHRRNRRKHCRHSLDAKNIRRVVKRSKYRALLELSHNLVIDELAAHELLRSVDNTMSYSLDVLKCGKHTILLISQCIENFLNTHCMVLDRHLLLELFLTSCLMLQASYLHSDPLNQTLGKKIIHLLTLHIKKLILK